MPQPFEMLTSEFLRIYAELCVRVPEVNEVTRAKSTSPIGQQAGAVIASIAASWKVAAAALENSSGMIATAGADGRLTPVARRDGMIKAAATLTSTVDALLVDAATSVDQLAIDLAKAATPPRPPASDAVLQEAMIAGIKSDVQMVLDRCATDYLPAQAADLVSTYAAAGNALAVWLLVGSGWIDMYFKSRGAPIDDYTSRIQQAIAGVDDPELTRARQLLSELNGPKGVRALLIVARHAANMKIDDLSRSFGLAFA